MTDKENQQRGLYPFKPGQSGNPAGSKKGKKLKTLLGLLLDTKYPESLLKQLNKDERRKLEQTFGTKNIKNQHMLMHKLFDEAMNGQLKAIDMIMDRTEGKVHQTTTNQNIEMSYEDYLLGISEPEGD